VAETTVTTIRFIPTLDELEDRHAGLGKSARAGAIDQLAQYTAPWAMPPPGMMVAEEAVSMVRIFPA
jgi:hypothetical protein